MVVVLEPQTEEFTDRYYLHNTTMGDDIHFNTCDPSNYSAILELSKLCVENARKKEMYDCFSKEISDTLSNFAGIWCVINAFLGFTGNLLTLLAIPYACWKKR